MLSVVHHSSIFIAAGERGIHHQTHRASRTRHRLAPEAITCNLRVPLTIQSTLTSIHGSLHAVADIAQQTSAPQACCTITPVPMSLDRQVRHLLRSSFISTIREVLKTTYFRPVRNAKRERVSTRPGRCLPLESEEHVR